MTPARVRVGSGCCGSTGRRGTGAKIVLIAENKWGKSEYHVQLAEYVIDIILPPPSSVASKHLSAPQVAQVSPTNTE